MLIAAPCRATLLIASRVGPALPLLQKQGCFPPKSRASHRQWAAWVLANRLGRLLRYYVLPSECC